MTREWGRSRENIARIEHAAFSLFHSGRPHSECADEQNAIGGAEKRNKGCGEEKKGVRRREKGGAEKRSCTLGPLYRETFLLAKAKDNL